ncbi:rod shape-determining protein MreC [Streptococcus dentiloxodontae]
MKNSIYRILVVSVITVLTFLLLFSFVFSRPKVVNAITSPVTSLVSKFDTVLSAPFSLLASAKDALGDFVETYKENTELKKTISELQSQKTTISNLKEENESLRASLNISESFSNQVTLTTKIKTRSTVSWLDVVSVNLGSSDGVEKSMIATANGGVIGVVSSVNDSTSTVSLLSNTEDEITLAAKAANNSGSTIYGIVSGYDSEKDLLKMTRLNSSADLAKGDKVVTSGLDGASVAEIPVGTVDSVVDEDNVRTIYIKPTADFTSISYVTLVGSGD